MDMHYTDCGRRDAGLRERRDCTVRATAAVLDITYPEAHSRLESIGRKRGKGFPFKEAAPKLGLETCPELSCRRLGEILPEMHEGRFVVRIARHVFAVINGVIHDTVPPAPHKLVKMVYRSKVANL